MAKSRRLALEPKASSGSRRGRGYNQQARAIFSCNFFVKIRNRAIGFPLIGPDLRFYEAPGGEEKGESYFYFFRHNPLKSPDSDE
jgi:hypothetical protein